MKIALVSKANILGGGASKVANHLALLLRADGHDVHHFRNHIEDGFTENSSSLYGKYKRLANISYYKLRHLGLQEIIPWEYLHLHNEIKKKKFDLIHFHDLSSSVSPFTLSLLSKKLPVVWTFHDCSPITGGCIFPLNCDNYLKDCKPCPQKNQWPLGKNFDLASFYLNVKKSIHKQQLYLISPSKWLAQLALSSGTTKNDITVINNSVDLSLYTNHDKDLMKEKLGIAKDRFTILFSAHTITNEFKGIQHALEVIKQLESINPLIIFVGALPEEELDTLGDIDYISSGYLNEPAEQNIYYSAADIFLNCSVADNFPLVVLESLASGTPIVGFNTGGIAEMVTQHQTGFLSNTLDTESLINKILEIYESKEYKIWSKNARRSAEQHYGQEQMLESHVQYYNAVIEDFKKPDKHMIG